MPEQSAAICLLFDFSQKVCHGFLNLSLLGSTFNQKGEHMNGA
jgi:hypothetical protein